VLGLHVVFLVLYVGIMLLLFWCGVVWIRILNSESDFITDMHKHKQKSQSVFTLKASSAKCMQKLFAAATITALLLMILSFRVDAQSGHRLFLSTSGTFTPIGLATRLTWRSLCSLFTLTSLKCPLAKTGLSAARWRRTTATRLLLRRLGAHWTRA
jgi:hypothetical protein